MFVEMLLKLSDIINILKNYLFLEIDGIRFEILKKIKEYIADPIVFTINNIIVTSIVLKSFKLLIVKSIYKSGSRLLIRNDRPFFLIRLKSL